MSHRHPIDIKYDRLGFVARSLCNWVFEVHRRELSTSHLLSEFLVNPKGLSELSMKSLMGRHTREMELSPIELILAVPRNGQLHQPSFVLLVPKHLPNTSGKMPSRGLRPHNELVHQALSPCM